MLWNIRNVLVLLIDLFLGVISFFIGFRILLELVGANTTTPFVSWIYAVSSGFTYPFIGIFPNIALNSVAFIDTVAVISLVAYMLVGYLFIALLDNLMRPRVVTTTDHEHIL